MAPSIDVGEYEGGDATLDCSGGTEVMVRGVQMEVGTNTSKYDN